MWTLYSGSLKLSYLALVLQAGWPQGNPLAEHPLMAHLWKQGSDLTLQAVLWPWQALASSLHLHPETSSLGRQPCSHPADTRRETLPAEDWWAPGLRLCHTRAWTETVKVGGITSVIKCRESISVVNYKLALTKSITNDWTTKALAICLCGDWNPRCYSCGPSTPPEGVQGGVSSVLQRIWWDMSLDSWMFLGTDFLISILTSPHI